MRRVQTVVLIGVLTLGLAVLGSMVALAAEAPPGYKIVYLTRATPSEPIFTYWTVAEQLGFFEEEGVDVGTGNGVIHLDAGETGVITGQGAATVSAPNTMIAFVAQDPNVNLLAIWNHTPKLHYVLAVLPDSPIRSVADLAGKRIAVPTAGHSVNVALPGILSEAGLTENDVQVIVVPGGAAAADAITSGKVDVLAYDDTRVARLNGLLGFELREIPLPSKISRAGGPIAVARRTDVERYPDLYVGYVRALIKAWIFVDTNPRAAAEMQLDRYPQLIPAGSTREEALEIVFNQMIARHSRMQVPEWAPAGTLYGEFLSDNWTAWLPVLPDIQGRSVPLERAYTNELVRKAWAGIDRAAVERLAREYGR